MAVFVKQEIEMSIVFVDHLVQKHICFKFEIQAAD